MEPLPPVVEVKLKDSASGDVYAANLVYVYDGEDPPDPLGTLAAVSVQVTSGAAERVAVEALSDATVDEYAVKHDTKGMSVAVEGTFESSLLQWRAQPPPLEDFEKVYGEYVARSNALRNTIFHSVSEGLFSFAGATAPLTVLQFSSAAAAPPPALPARSPAALATAASSTSSSSPDSAGDAPLVEVVQSASSSGTEDELVAVAAAGPAAAHPLDAMPQPLSFTSAPQLPEPLVPTRVSPLLPRPIATPSPGIVGDVFEVTRRSSSARSHASPTSTMGSGTSNGTPVAWLSDDAKSPATLQPPSSPYKEVDRTHHHNHHAAAARDKSSPFFPLTGTDPAVRDIANLLGEL